MNIHPFSTGTVRITENWKQGHGHYVMRLMRSLFDSRLTDPLPIWCYVIEHPEGLIVVDAGILTNANDPIFFPPHMILVRRAAPFQIETQDEEIGMQLKKAGFSPSDVRWLILTHLHQDHDGGVDYFPNAKLLISRAEWQSSRGLKGRMAGYLSRTWHNHAQPHLIDFTEPDPIFGKRYNVTQAGDVYLVPTIGHSHGHMSVIIDEGDHAVFIAGDASYSQALLLADALDGVGQNAKEQHLTHQKILTFARQKPTVYLPAHEWEAQNRLRERQPLMFDNA